MGVPGLKVILRSVALNISGSLAQQLALALALGSTSASVTSTAVTRFRSCALRPMKSLLSASAMKKR
jgi:hypothetical protein